MKKLLLPFLLLAREVMFSDIIALHEFLENE